ncbi:GH16 domain-containing protein [Mycena indigotica]|uniref:GH16 domain-containing protein n=1 Tax=Mycena indigotica TaxID=2126181 RepID=A0A8H6S1S8_9AGAR|nr:GH16 domain-containing protein [Mycena indigotica]KAF7291349.1 GH16 domain-containing protein [Mycena indigotica]
MQSDASGLGQRRGYAALNSSSNQLLPSSPNSPISPFRSPASSASSLPLSPVPGSLRQSLAPSISDRFHLSADPADWGADVSRPEADDALHDPRDGRKHNNGSIFTSRGFWNVGCIALLACILIGLFLGYPIATHITSKAKNTSAATVVNNTTAPVWPNISNWGLIDNDTPKEFHRIYSYHDPTKEMQLVFSDEFETEGRTFYPGDDPYFEAVDLHYWSTGDLEWYDPAAVTTRAGALEISMNEVLDISQNHNMSYRSGMLSSWNKFCFTGGLIMAAVNLPGTTNVLGLWPAVWTMGNLGRAGYGATLEGMWPYSYDTCDVGTLPNQTLPDGSGPPAALHSGSKDVKGELSYLPGQRLSRCVCPGESHPGPMHKDGTYVGRSAPEIDIFEAQIEEEVIGRVRRVIFPRRRQSAQWAPFDAGYNWVNTSDTLYIADPTLSKQNSYSGGIWQQATSVVSTTNQDCYQLKSPCFAVHAFEYIPGYDDAYITWVTDNKVSWTMRGGAVGKNELAQIGPREVTREPLYILINLGLSHGFVWDIDFKHLTWPAVMRIDWIRVYQDPNQINVGCDTPERPTAQYINTYLEAYTNPNLTTWEDGYHQPVPKNKLNGGC